MQAMIDELAKQAAESLGQVSSKETLASFWQAYSPAKTFGPLRS